MHHIHVIMVVMDGTVNKLEPDNLSPFKIIKLQQTHILVISSPGIFLVAIVDHPRSASISKLQFYMNKLKINLDLHV